MLVSSAPCPCTGFSYINEAFLKANIIGIVFTMITILFYSGMLSERNYYYF